MAKRCCPTRPSSQKPLRYLHRHRGLRPCEEFYQPHHGLLQLRVVQLLLAKEPQLFPRLKLEEVGQDRSVDAEAPRRAKNLQVEHLHIHRRRKQRRTDNQVVLAAVAPCAVEVGHLRDHARRRPPEQRGELLHRKACSVCRAAAESAVIDQQRRAQTQHDFARNEVLLALTGYDNSAVQDRSPLRGQRLRRRLQEVT